MQLTKPLLFELHLFSHAFELRVIQPLIASMLIRFCSQYVVKPFTADNANPQEAQFKTFANMHTNGLVYRFHISQLDHFMLELQELGVTDQQYSRHVYPPVLPLPISFELTSGKEPRDYQIKALDFIKEKIDNPNLSRLLQMPTGTGKTFTSFLYAKELSQRFAVVVEAKYADKWKTDVLRETDIVEDDILCINTSQELKMLMLKANSPDLSNIKVIIFRLTVMLNAIKAYEAAQGEYETIGHEFAIYELFYRLQIGLTIFDEVHRSLHQVYKVVSYLHAGMVLGLSATMISMDRDVERMQHLLFAKTLRFDDIQMKKYIQSYSIWYQIENIHSSGIRTSNRGMSTYSQSAFEESILSRPSLLIQYLDLVAHCVKFMFYDENPDYQKGDRAAIYAYTKEMCEKIKLRLIDHYPDLDIRRYVAEDPYENIIDPDVRVTTVGSGGTAVDIPRLTFVFLTCALNSPSSNLQVLGRLRHIEGKVMKFAALTCLDIPRQVKYDKDRVVLIQEKVMSHKNLRYPKVLVATPKPHKNHYFAQRQQPYYYA